MGPFLNEFVVNLHIFLPLVVATALGLPVFGYFYNRVIDRLREHEHMSIYVLMGTLVTLGVGALFSWKSALLFLILFGLDGLPMVVGEYRRTARRSRPPRRKRLPYAANGLLDEAKMAGEEARRVLGRAIKGEGAKEDLIIVERELNTMMLRIIEIKGIQGGPG